MIALDVEGNHVAAALDCLFGTKPAVGGLVVPYLAEGLILRISMLKAIEVVLAASSGNCMPGMVLQAVDKIKRRALFWHNKALRHAAAEAKKASSARPGRETASRERDPDPELEEGPAVAAAVDDVDQGKSRKATLKVPKSKAHTAVVPGAKVLRVRKAKH